MKLRTVIYSLLLAALCMGCGGRLSMRQLEQLEARINDAPDSVLAVLTAADMPRWGERRALYALLTVQAQDKSYVDVTNDSLISVATDYYQRKGQPLRRLQAFYYHGRVYQRKGSSHDALVYYTRALDFVSKVEVPYPIALLMAQLGILYGNVYDYSQALSYMESALHYYTIAGKERMQNITKRNLAKTYLNMNDFSQAEKLLHEVLEWGEANKDTYIIYSTLRLLFRLYDGVGDFGSLNHLLESYPLNTFERFTDIYAIAARFYAINNDIPLATQTLSQAWNMSSNANDTLMLYQKSFQIYQTLGLIDEALDSHVSLLAKQDSIVRITLQQPLMTVQRDYYHSELDLAKARNLNYRYLLGFLALIILIAVIVVWGGYREMCRKKELEVKQYIDAADQLRVTLYHKEEELGKVTDALQQQATDTVTLQQRIASLFKEQYNLLDELCTTYYENPKDELRSGHIFEQVRNTIDSFSSDEGYAKLEAIVNDGCNDVVARLRRELPKFKEADFRLLCYFCAGFSIQAICLFTQEEPKKLWVYKSRLITRIKNSDAPSKDIILAQIPQRIR